jgi:transposase, IS30 family
MGGLRAEQGKRDEIRRLYFGGMGPSAVAVAVGCSEGLVFKVVRALPFPLRKRSKLRLSLKEREEIALGVARTESLRSIARRLKRAASTVSREVAAQMGRPYRAWRGDERAERLAARPKPRKLEGNPALVKAVETKLSDNWSPEQISRYLRDSYPENPAMHVSHETLYKTLYLQGRGALRKELTRHLRTGRPKRHIRARAELRGRIKDMVNISQRPPEVADRAVPGHWEGDLITGTSNKSAIGTLVERTTRYVMLLHLPNGHTALEVREALTEKIKTLPQALSRSLTWDQGRELAQHAQFTIDTGVKVFFCDPHSPWQRGSNENTNGLLRQYFPKSTDLSTYTPEDLDRAAISLNRRPRQTLGWKTPSEKLNELLR